MAFLWCRSKMAYNVFRLGEGGDGSLGFKHSEKTKLKMSKTRKCNKNLNKSISLITFIG